MVKLTVSIRWRCYSLSWRCSSLSLRWISFCKFSAPIWLCRLRSFSKNGFSCSEQIFCKFLRSLRNFWDWFGCHVSLRVTVLSMQCSKNLDIFVLLVWLMYTTHTSTFWVDTVVYSVKCSSPMCQTILVLPYLDARLLITIVTINTQVRYVAFGQINSDEIRSKLVFSTSLPLFSISKHYILTIRGKNLICLYQNSQ